MPTGQRAACVVIVTPVRRWARAAARKARSSAAVIQRSQAISPMIPARMPVPSTPTSRSSTISSASSSTVIRSMRARSRYGSR